MSAIGKRYARAAVLAAEEKGGASAVDSLASGLRDFCEAYDASQELRDLLLNPVFKEERPKVLSSVLDRLGVSPQVQTLIRLLSERDRIGIMADVADEVEAIADERVNRVRAHVSSATPLSSSQTERVKEALEKRLGQTVVVNVHIDPTLLGGLVCRVGDLTLDTSLRHQLDVLRDRFERHAS